MSGICLIGESDPFIAQLLRRFSEESGLDPLQARVGQDVLSLAQQQPPELVIIEPDLPGKLRGWEAIQAMRKEPHLRTTPVVTCSWRQADEAAEMVHSADGHLQKPELHYDDFLAMLESIGIGPEHTIPQRSDGNG